MKAVRIPVGVEIDRECGSVPEGGSRRDLFGLTMVAARREVR